MQKDSLIRNIFGNNEETKESKTNINNGKITNNNLFYNNNSIEKGNIIKQNYSSTDLKTYNTNYILSTNSNNNIIDSNSKFDQNISSSNFYMPANKRSSDKTIDNYYKMIINNIDDKLFNIHKYNKNKRPVIKKRIDKTFSSDKIKTYTDISFKSPINTFRDSTLQNKQFYNNKYNYGGLFNKINRKIGGLKLLAH